MTTTTPNPLHRLLELAGLIRLTEALTKSEAIAILTGLGATPDNMSSADNLKAYRRKVMMQVHQDQGGSKDMAQNTNAAIDLLIAIGGVNPATPDEADPVQNQNIPEWARAGYRGGPAPDTMIHREDYTDVNFIRQTMYDLSSDGPQEEFHIMAFDGYNFTRDYYCFCSMKHIDDMAIAMITLNSKGADPHATMAVFFQRNKSKELFLVYANKHMHFPPVPFDYDGNQPSEDHFFMRRLPQMIKQLN